MSHVCLSVSSPDFALGSVPRYCNLHLYQWLDAEGRVISVSSSAARPDLYAPLHGLYHQSKLGSPHKDWMPNLPLAGVLEAELVRSEGRRSALTESLLGAQSAMRYQDVCLQEQDRDLVTCETQLEHLLFKQEFIASKFCQLKTEKNKEKAATLPRVEYGEKPMTRWLEGSKKSQTGLGQRHCSCDECCRNPGHGYTGDLLKRTSPSLNPHFDKYGRWLGRTVAGEARSGCREGCSGQGSRISALELEMRDIRSQMETGLLNGRAGTPPSVDTPSQVRDGCEEEVWEELQKDAQSMLESRHLAEQETDSLQLQMTSVNSLLFQSKLSANQLAREKLLLQAELDSSRNISEKLLLEVAALRQNMESLQESVAENKSSEAESEEKIQSLREENQRLLSQKELLLETVKKTKRNVEGSHGVERQDTPPKSESQASKGPSLFFHAHELPPAIVSSSIPQVHPPAKGHSGKILEVNYGEVLQDAQETKHAQGRPCHASKEASPFFCLHEVPPGVVPSDPHPRDYLPAAHVPNPNLDKEDNAHDVQRPREQQERSPGKVPRNRSKTAKHRSKRSEAPASSDKYYAPRRKMSLLLRKLEGLLASNVKVNLEKEQILVDLLAALRGVRDAETSSGQRRKEVESLLGQHVNLAQNFHNRENQIMAVIIELQNLRKAYEAALKHSSHPDDVTAMSWVSRVNLIKSCLDALQDHQAKNKLLNEENNHIRDQLQ